MLSANAKARWVRITPRKMRLVADMVRGRPVEDAMNILNYSTKRASEPVEKAVRSAYSNLLSQDGMSKLTPSDAFIQEIKVDEGATWKRWRPRAMGRAYRILKRTSHVTVVVATHIDPEKGKKAKAKQSQADK